MLHVVNYRGRQVHSTSVFSRVNSAYILFEDGTYACIADGTTGGPGSARFVWRDDDGDDGYLPPSSEVGEGIVVVNVADDGSYLARGVQVNRF